MVKYQFKVRTRSGMVVEAITIQGRDREDAERKLNQMYLGSTILECTELAPPATREESLDIGGIISLISKQD
ncbi:MAG: hypothetical protein GC151_04305 [Betaproteobacteria bacterium]|nr:hypothetical protein [Betaproteobacteria bacterium]